MKLRLLLGIITCFLVGIGHPAFAEVSIEYDDEDDHFLLIPRTPAVGAFLFSYDVNTPTTDTLPHRDNMSLLHPITDTTASKTCNITRFVVELGSSNVKFYSGRYNVCTNNFDSTSVMQLAKYPLNLANYMDQNGNLTNDGITLVIRTIQDVQEKITAIGRTELSVIATAAIRDAKNQRQILDAIAQVRGVSVTVLSHTEEADFGVGTAYALMASMGNETPENAIFVDQGGASIQVINIRGGNELVVERFLGKIGTHLVADKVKSIFYAELGLHENQIFPFPRVAGRDSGVLHYLYSLIANLLQLKGEKPSDFLGNSTTAYGVARAHQFCVLPLANPNGDHFTINEVDAALFQLSQLGEKAIKERYPSVQKPLDDFATMLLTYTIMRNFGIDKIVVLPIPGSSLASAVKLLPHWTSASRYTQPYWTGVASSQFDSMHEPLNITTIVNAFRPEKRAQFSLCITCPLAFNK